MALSEWGCGRSGAKKSHIRFTGTEALCGVLTLQMVSIENGHIATCKSCKRIFEKAQKKS